MSYCDHGLRQAWNGAPSEQVCSVAVSKPAAPASLENRVQGRLVWAVRVWHRQNRRTRGFGSFF